MSLSKFNNMDLIKSDILNWQFFKLCYPQINFNFFIRPIFYLTFSFSSLPLSGLKKKEKTKKKITVFITLSFWHNEKMSPVL